MRDKQGGDGRCSGEPARHLGLEEGPVGRREEGKLPASWNERAASWKMRWRDEAQPSIDIRPGEAIDPKRK